MSDYFKVEKVLNKYHIERSDAILIRNCERNNKDKPCILKDSWQIHKIYRFLESMSYEEEINYPISSLREGASPSLVITFQRDNQTVAVFTYDKKYKLYEQIVYTMSRKSDEMNIHELHYKVMRNDIVKLYDIARLTY